jgi:hypothetical protein
MEARTKGKTKYSGKNGMQKECFREVAQKKDNDTCLIK